MKKYRILFIDDEFKARDMSRKETISQYFTNDWLLVKLIIIKRKKLKKSYKTE